jgi:hypothetical protein
MVSIWIAAMRRCSLPVPSQETSVIIRGGGCGNDEQRQAGKKEFCLLKGLL